MGKLIAIYALYDPAAPAQIRYVGKSNDPILRLAQHIRTAKGGSRPVSVWIRSLLKAGRRPEFKVIAYCSPLYWEETETRYIRLHAQNGHRLCNVSGGGRAGYAAKRAQMAAKMAVRKSGALNHQPSKRKSACR